MVLDALNATTVLIALAVLGDTIRKCRRGIWYWPGGSSDTIVWETGPYKQWSEATAVAGLEL